MTTIKSKIGSEKWLIIPKNPNELLLVTKDLITEIRELCDTNLKLQQLKNNKEMIEKLDEVLKEIDLQYNKITLTIHSEMVYLHLKGLRVNIEKIYSFFNDLNQTRVMFFAQGRLRKQMIVLYNNLRQSCTQLMAAVSLELLTIKRKEDEEKEKEIRKQLLASSQPPVPIPRSPSPIPIDNSLNDLLHELYEGHKFFYGINKFKNYLRAFKHYHFAAERGQVDAMIMIGIIYQNGYGTEKNLKKAIEWYKHAEELGSSAAKYFLAFLLLDEVI